VAEVWSDAIACSCVLPGAAMPLRNVQTLARKVPVPRGEFSNIPFRIIVVFDDLGGFQGSADRVRTRDTFRHNSGGGCP
jgi:hypothetical protein